MPICGYCGVNITEAEITADHVPPKSLFSKPYPENLWTVPSCKSCNSSFQLDDEYARVIASLDVRAADNQDVKLNFPKIIRSLQRPNAKGFVSYLESQKSPTSVIQEDGSPMGALINVDRKRINNVGERLIRGLFFLEKGAPISTRAQIKVGDNLSVNHLDPVIIQAAKIYTNCSEQRDKEIGTTFSYAVGFGEGFSVWIMLLYDYFCWVGTVDLRDVKIGT